MTLTLISFYMSYKFYNLVILIVISKIMMV